ncbi:hypothetical protein EVAR_99960_1 [Eumeta japonica]|uniref:Uncharacterized protein n=1 Tax=Eumeta variegata TaxID=151549 RepID=A0A4C2A4Q6_EUMVA|nr:hypothetical protein EVAR_99960_1 [Eumeta japonica]
MRAALIRSASTSVRPPAVGCVSSLSCASLPSSSTDLRRSPPPPAGDCAMTARARVWVGDWAPADVNQWIQTDHCHLSRRGRVPDEKTPGHEAKYKSSVPYLHPQIRVWKPTNERTLLSQICEVRGHAPSNMCRSVKTYASLLFAHAAPDAINKLNTTEPNLQNGYWRTLNRPISPTLSGHYPVLFPRLRRPQPRAHFILKASRNSYAEEPLEGTHRIVTRRRHLHAAQAAFPNGGGDGHEGHHHHHNQGHDSSEEDHSHEGHSKDHKSSEEVGHVHQKGHEGHHHHHEQGHDSSEEQGRHLKTLGPHSVERDAMTEADVPVICSPSLNYFQVFYKRKGAVSSLLKDIKPSLCLREACFLADHRQVYKQNEWMHR